MPKWSVVDAFRHLGADSSDRYAWSAQSPDKATTVLTLWEDEIYDDGSRVVADYFDHPKIDHWAKQRGNNARKRHLVDVWEGNRKFRVVMVRAKDVNAQTRNAKERWPDDHLTMTLLAFNPETGEFRAEGVRTKPTQPTAGTGWSEAELRACVEAYKVLWLAQKNGESVNESALRRDVKRRAMSSRSETAYERRMQNISAVVDELGIEWVKGYAPLKNVGNVKAELVDLINDIWDRKSILEKPTADPDDLETRVLSATQKLGGQSSDPPPGSKSVSRVAASSTQFVRDPEVIAWVREQADGICEACDQAAPFFRADGIPFLEVHHVRPLAEGGPDTTDNAIAGCPNCHRRLHHSNDRKEFRKAVIAKIDRLIDHPKKNTVA